MLDPATLAAIAAEARNCFLLEDAPDYLAMLQSGMAKLQQAYQHPSSSDDNLAPIYKDLARAADSLKGGAGMAQMHRLHKLTHKLEDIFESLEQGRLQDKDTALQLLMLAVEEVQNLLEESINEPEYEESENSTVSELTLALEEFLATATSGDGSNSNADQTNFIATALNVDLEACIVKVEQSLNQGGGGSHQVIQQQFLILEEQSTLLGQALNFSQLIELISLVRQIRELNIIPLTELVPMAIATMRQLREQFLHLSDSSSPDLLKDLLAEWRQLLPQASPPLQPDPEPPPTPKEPEKIVSDIHPTVHVRIPLSRITQMNHTVGELLINYESLLLYDKQLQQANLNLKKRCQQLPSLQDQVTFLYDQLTTNQKSLSVANSAEFDNLEFDQYSDIHTTLQQFQELMVQVNEIREDLDLIRREFHETIVQVHNSLDTLENDLTQSQLLPFGSLANSFLQPLQQWNQRYFKQVELLIEGENVWVDQLVLEQLRTPLIHLLRNAFDHGIETPQERVRVGKNPTGTIKLSALINANELVIILTDDGRGINIEKVHQKAKENGLCSNNNLTPKQILSFIFEPGFSTTNKVTDLSGRGVGLDVVRLQVEKLRGSINVDTKSGAGTKFTIRLRLNLNLLPLLIFRCQQQILAIPSVSVINVMSLSEFHSELNGNHSELQTIPWQDQWLTLLHLSQILPYHQQVILNTSSLPKIALILRMNETYVAIAIDEIITEREMVIKPFDDIVPVPPYLAGCTILGNGKVVPILIPNYFDSLLANLDHQLVVTPPPTEIAQAQTTSILVVDDSIAIRKTLNRLLTQCNYQVVLCRDGKEAWTVLNKENQMFNLVISDLEMPGFDGFKLLQMIRSHSRHQNLPVIILTSRENDLHRQKALNLGANAYVTKPFAPVAFIDKIGELL